MKKFLVLLCVAFFASNLYAQEGSSKAFSAGISFGYLSNLAGLGATIMKDGEFDTAGDSLAGSTQTTQILMSDKDNAIGKHNSESTNVGPLNFLKDYTEGGPMSGINVELYGMYDMNPEMQLPLFGRIGFAYLLQTGGGEQERVLASGVDQYAAAYDYPLSPTGTYDGATMSTTWTSSWMEIPITVGICLPIGAKGKIYGGFGISYFSGGWAVEYKTDDAYSAYLTGYEGEKKSLVTEGATEKIEFIYSGIGLNFLIGAEAFVMEDLAITVDYWMSGGGATIFSESDLKSTSSRLLALSMSNKLATTDPDYLKRIAYPTVLGGAYFKLGLKYYIL